jgi:tetratricopeptide (TPR) repeat protein
LGKWHVSRLPDFLDAYADEWDSDRLMEAIEALSSLSSTTPEESLGLHISMHPLVHAWAKDRQDSKSLKEDVLINVGSIIALSRTGSEIWQDSERYLRPHMQSYMDSEAQLISSHGRNPQILPVLLRCCWILNDMRDDSRLARFFKNIFHELGRDQHSPSRDILPIYKVTAKHFYDLAHYEESVQLLEQIVEIENDALINKYEPDLLTSQHLLASAYLENNQVLEAVGLLEQVIKIQEKTLPETHPNRLASQHVLANAYLENNQVLEAVGLLEQVVKILEKTLPETHPNRLASQHVLASAYLENNQVLEAVGLLEQVVKITEKTLPETHPNRLASQHVLAGAYLERGHDADITEAIKLLKHVVKTEESILAADDPSRIKSVNMLAEATLESERRERARLRDHQDH